MHAQDSEAPQRDAFAIHEAGHAVVAEAHGYPVEVIVVEGPGRGAVHLKTPVSEEGDDAGRHRLLSVDVAGRVAEAIQRDEPIDAVAAGFVAGARLVDDEMDCEYDHDHAVAFGHEGDDADVAIHLRDQSDEERAGAITDACELAREVLEARWAKVEACATSLEGVAQ